MFPAETKSSTTWPGIEPGQVDLLLCFSNESTEPGSIPGQVVLVSAGHTVCTVVLEYSVGHYKR